MGNPLGGVRSPAAGTGGFGTSAGGRTAVVAARWGIGGRAMGGGGAGRAGALGMGGRAIFGASRATPFPGGWAGRLIRTVSRGSPPSPEVFVGTRGGKVMRTVSFFGSFRSLMALCDSAAINSLKRENLSLVNFAENSDQTVSQVAKGARRQLTGSASWPTHSHTVRARSKRPVIMIASMRTRRPSSWLGNLNMI